MKRLTEWLSNILLTFATAVVSVVLIELALQICYPAHGAWRLFHFPDPELGWILQPGARFQRHVRGTFVPVSYNSDGFRDDEFNKTDAKQATRIIVLGDSYMEANMVPVEQVLHKRLEKLAGNEDRRLATYNLGVAHYGTLQEYLAYERVGAKREPALVLLAFYLQNDIRNNSEALNTGAIAKRGARKRPYLDEAQTGTWRVHAPDYARLKSKYEKNQASRFFRAKQRSVLYTLWQAAEDSFESVEEYFGHGSSLGMHRCTISPLVETGWQTTTRILQKLRDRVQETGARLVVFSVPSIVESDRRIAASLHEEGKKLGLDLCVEDSPGYRRLRDTLQSLAIPYVNLLPDFRTAVSDQGRELFVPGDWHWNGEGHALAAQRLYSELKERGLLPR